MDASLVAVFGFIGAIWGGFNALSTTQKQLNEMRNIILTGVLDGVAIPLCFRHHILENDWLPTWKYVSVINFTFGLGILSAPLFIDITSHKILFWIVTIVAALVPILAAFTWIKYGKEDLAYIRAVLKKRECEEPANTRDLQQPQPSKGGF